MPELGRVKFALALGGDQVYVLEQHLDAPLIVHTFDDAAAATSFHERQAHPLSAAKLAAIPRRATALRRMQ